MNQDKQRFANPTKRLLYSVLLDSRYIIYITTSLQAWPRKFVGARKPADYNTLRHTSLAAHNKRDYFGIIKTMPHRKSSPYHCFFSSIILKMSAGNHIYILYDGMKMRQSVQKRCTFTSFHAQNHRHRCRYVHHFSMMI